jgi:hypothetical protein
MMNRHNLANTTGSNFDESAPDHPFQTTER